MGIVWALCILLANHDKISPPAMTCNNVQLWLCNGESQDSWMSCSISSCSTCMTPAVVNLARALLYS